MALTTERLYDQICGDCADISRSLDNITERENTSTINDAMNKIGSVEEYVRQLSDRTLSVEKECSVLYDYTDKLEGFLSDIMITVKIPIRTKNDDGETKLGEIRAWLRDSAFEPHIELTDGRFLFMREEDATLFKLTWGGR